MNRILVGVVVVGLLFGCEQRSSVGVSRSGLEQAPDDNIFTRAVALEPVGEAWVMVSEADYYTALKSVEKPTSPVEKEAVLSALAVASAANESWTSGVAGGLPTTGLVEGANWIVVSEAQAFQEQVIASNFRLSFLQLSMKPSWYSKGVVFTRSVGSLGAGRCCGPTVLCNSPPTSNGPCGAESYCGGDTYVTNYDTGAADAARTGGHNSRSISFYSNGLPLPTDCHSRLAPSCSNTNGMCGKEIGIDISTDWDSSLPLGSGACGGLGESPVGGRNPPDRCLYANSKAPSSSPAGAGGTVTSGDSRAPECDGRCFDCESGPDGVDNRSSKKFRPPQCDMLKTAPPGSPGAPGSGVCTASTAQEVLDETQLIRIQYFGGPNGTGTHCEFINNQGLELCTSCDLDGCRKTARRAGVEYPPPGNGQAGIFGGASNGDGTREFVGKLPAGRTAADGPPSSPRGSPMGPLVGATGGADEGATPQQSVEHSDHTAGADPVALGSGAFELHQTDLRVPGPTRALEFTRSYDSRSKHRSSLGSNWTHNWDVRIVPLNDSNRPSWVDPFCAGSPEETTCLMLHVGASERLFTLDVTTGVYTPQAGVFSSITKIASGWRLVGADMHRMEFDSDGYLVLDLDRFDHGFLLEYEFTPQGVAFDSYCPREVPRPSRSSGVILDPVGPTGISASHALCRILGGLVGQRHPQAYRLTASDEWSLTANWTTLTGEAAPYFVKLMWDDGRNGSPMPWGAALKRITRASEVAAVSYVGPDRIPEPQAGGHALVFTYAPEGNFLSDGRLEDANLLQQVSVENESLSVSFKYDVPLPSAPGTAWMNEVLLQTVTREDARKTRFEYGASQINDADVLAAGQRFREFLRAQVGCTSYTMDHCGKPVFPSFTRYDIESDVADYEATLRSEAADNISLVERDGIVESETRYEVNPFALNFDRVTAQRWGSSSVPPTPLSGTFTTTLPEARIEYSEAMPINGGSEDATTAFLGTTFAVRYPLEALPGGAITDASGKGMLLPPGSADGSPIASRLPPLAEGFRVPQWGTNVPACLNTNLPWLRSRLAGYAPSLDYFDAPAATSGSTPGVDLDAPLKRSRLSCASLAMAQTWDARHNDLQWSWAIDGNGEMTATRVLGRRANTNANANRICAWSRLTDRDGVVHLYGLNYQGRTLVDGVQLGMNDWRIAETLYNADGNVVSQRRTTPASANWTPATGDTQYEYMDVYKNAANVNVEPLPFFWARRGNVTRVLQHPRGAVADYLQNSSAPPTTPTARFVRYTYEPLFNQVSQVASGTLPGGVVDSVIDVTFDYQEANIGALTPLLQFQQTLGFQYHETVTTVGGVTTSVLEAGTALGWPVTFNLGDQNADLLVGSTVLGLPVKVVANGDTTLYRWNEGGRLISVQSPDGSELRNEYYSYGLGLGPSAAGNRGHLAKQFHLGRTTWWPNASLGAGCAALSGPYQWLLPAGCSTTDLQTVLKLPPEAVAQITASSSDGTLTLEYDSRGHLHRRLEADGRVTTWVRDVDGRVTTESLYDGATLHSSTEIGYDSLKHPTSWTAKNATGAVIGKDSKVWDEEDHVLVDCHEWVSGACANITRGSSPAGAAANSYYYTNEGRLERRVDPEAAELEYIRDARGWVVRTLATAPGELARETCTTYDDDGNTTRRDFGNCGLSGLYETRTWDGFNRPTGMRDTENRSFTVKNSRLDQTLEVSFVGSPAWKTSWTYDTAGRVTSETLNGNLVEQYNRGPGGLVISSQSYGTAPVFTTYDADGNVVWQRDSDSRITSVYTSRPNSRTRTASTIRTEGGKLHTTSSIVTVDELGLPATSKEVGESLTATSISRTTTFLRDEKGHLKQQNDPDGAVVEFVYDFGGRLDRKKAHVPAGFEETIYSPYNRRGAVLGVQDPKLETTTFAYTGYGELKSRTSPGAGGAVVAQFVYDTLGRTTEERLGTSRLQYIYNGLGQLWKIQNGESILRAYAYDNLGRLQTATNFNLGPSAISPTSRTVTTGFGYDWAGRTSSETNTIAGRPQRSVTSTWSGGTMPMSLTRYSTRPGTTVDDQFDGLGRLQNQARPLGTTGWTYVGEMERERRRYSGSASVITTIDQDALGQTKRELTHGQTDYQFDILRDDAGRTGSLAKRIGLPSGVEENWRGFIYDLQGRISDLHEASTLPQITVGSGKASDVALLAANVSAARWKYDREPKVGSTVAITGPGPARLDAATRGAGYQLSSYKAGGAVRSLTYDTAGRVSTHAGTTHSWDDFSLLTRVSGPGVDESLQYDGVGRLVGRYGGATLVEEYVWDGSQMVTAFNGGTTQLWSAFWAQGIDDLVTVKVGDIEYNAVGDGRGSIGAWYRATNATLAATAEYTPEGRTQTRVVGGATCDEVGSTATCPAPLEIPFGFHSAFKSAGTGLIYFRNRWYSSVSGEWLSQDPLGPVDSHNLYAFNAFDTVNYFDPYGLSRTGDAEPYEPTPSVPCSAAEPGCWEPGPGSGSGSGSGSGTGTSSSIWAGWTQQQKTDAVMDRAQGRAERPSARGSSGSTSAATGWTGLPSSAPSVQLAAGPAAGALGVELFELLGWEALLINPVPLIIGGAIVGGVINCAQGGKCDDPLSKRPDAFQETMRRVREERAREERQTQMSQEKDKAQEPARPEAPSQTQNNTPEPPKDPGKEPNKEQKPKPSDGIKLTGKAREILRDPALRQLKDSTLREGILQRGGGGSVVRKAGELADQKIGDIANRAAQGDERAVEGIKLLKDAARLGAKNHGQ